MQSTANDSLFKNGQPAGLVVSVFSSVREMTAARNGVRVRGEEDEDDVDHKQKREKLPDCVHLAVYQILFDVATREDGTEVV